MKWYLSVTKQKAVSHVQGVPETGESQAECDSHSINEIKQVTDLKSQLTSLMKQRKTTVAKKEQPKKSETKKT